MATGKINIFDSNWVDMVFQGRNHDYGAYELRKKGDSYTNRGIVLAIVVFTLAISAPLIYNYIQTIIPKKVVETKEVEVTLKEPPPIDKDQPPPPPPPEPPPLKTTVKFTPPEIKPDQEVPDEPPPTQEEMKDKEAATKAVEGDPNGVDQSLIGNGDGVTGEEAPEILTFAEQMPEFEGGMEALNNYLVKHLDYPPIARENGIEGKVILSFVVGTDGKITQIEVLKKLGWGLEEEAIRVVKSMPSWKPGKQNGKAVTVKFTLPITFKMN